MSLPLAVFFGLLQGLTEFLPVSSSGHLTLLQNFFPLSIPPLLLTVLVHAATLLAVLIYFRKQLIEFFRQQLDALIAATFPAIIAGWMVYQSGQSIFESPLLVGLALLFTSLLLFSTRFLKKGSLSLNQVQVHQAFIIGLFQALSLLPGVSRSGATIVSGLWLGLSYQAAFSFSFLLSIPAILGALSLSVPDLSRLGPSLLLPSILAFTSALLAGLASLRLLDILIKRKRLFGFGFYTLILAGLVLGLYL